MENTVSGGETPINLVERAKALLLQPTQTWEKIALETASLKSLYTGYVMILAAIPAVGTFVGTSFVGVGLPGVLSVKMPILWAVPIAIVQYVISLVMVYIFAVVIDAMAPNFGTEKNRPQAIKVAAYSGTAAWLVGIFAFIPALGVLGLLGLYSIYLLYRGLDKLMKAPQDKRGSYTAVVCVIMIVAGFVLNLLTVPLNTIGLAGAGAGLGMFGANKAAVTGEIAVPGGSVDLSKLEKASNDMQSAASAMSTGEGVKVADGAALQALLPMTLDGSSQLNVESETNGAGGMSASTAKALYNAGTGGSITLTITDMGAAGAITALGSAFNVNHSKQTASGYEKVATVNGDLIAESYDNSTQSGEYSIITNKRLMIEAKGEKVGMDKIKAAVNAVDKTKALSLMK